MAFGWFGEPVYTPYGDKPQRGLGCLGLALGQGDMVMSSPHGLWQALGEQLV